jgi:hypothetical protein
MAGRLDLQAMRALSESPAETAARLQHERQVLQDVLEAAMRALTFLGDPYARQTLRAIRQQLAVARIEVNA